MKKLFNFMMQNAFGLSCIAAAIAVAIAVVAGDSTLVDAIFGTGGAATAVVAGAANLGNEGGVADGPMGAGKHVTGRYMSTEANKAATGEDTLIENEVDREIVKMYQSALPFDQFLRHTKAKPTKSMEYDYYSIDPRPILGVVAGASNVTGVKNGQSVKIPVDNPYIFNIGDTVRVGKVLGNDKDTPTQTTPGIYLMVYVLGREAAEGENPGKISVQPINAYNAAGLTIPAGSKLYRVAAAAHEGDVQIAAYSALPTKKTQRMQIFKSQTMETSIHIESNKKIEWTPTDQDEYMVYDFRRQIEAASIFGVGGVTQDINANREVYTCSGAVEQILKGDPNNVITFPDLETLADSENDSWFIELTKSIFVGNNGSRRRLVFMGSELVAAISKIDTVKRQIESNSTERVYGYTWSKIVTNFGELLVYNHPLFDEYGFDQCAIVLDPQYVEKRVFRSIDTDQLKLKEAGVFDGRANVITEISSVVLKYPKCHKLVVPAVFNQNGTFGEAA